MSGLYQSQRAELSSHTHSFINVDMALYSGLQPWLGLRRWNQAYDVSCQQAINVAKRWKEIQAILPSLRREYKGVPDTLLIIYAIGKFHAPAHAAHCRTRYSFRYLPGVGMTDGEAQERVWSGTNNLALRTREMAGDNRHDTYNFYFDDRNLQRCNGMGMCSRDFINTLLTTVQRLQLLGYGSE